MDRVVAEPASRRFISRFTILEIESALALKFRTGELNADSLLTARRRLEADLGSRRLFVAMVTDAHLREARRLLIDRGTPRPRCLAAVRGSRSQESRFGVRFHCCGPQTLPCSHRRGFNHAQSRATHRTLIEWEIRTGPHRSTGSAGGCSEQGRQEGTCTTVVQAWTYNQIVLTRRKPAAKRRSASVRQSVTIPAQLAREVRRVAKERNVTMSRALVTLAERGVAAEASARATLMAAYDRFMAEGDPARKTEIGEDLIRAIFGRAGAVRKIQKELRPYRPRLSVVDELLAERRAEAENE